MSDWEDGNCFAIPDLYRSSLLWSSPSQSNTLLFPTLPLYDIDVKRPDYGQTIAKNEDFFAVSQLHHDLDEDCIIPTPPIERHEEVVLQVEDSEDSYDDSLWNLDNEDHFPTAKYLSWDAFESGKHNEHQTSYISEVSTGVLDAVFADERDAFQAGSVDYLIIQTKTFATSLVSLGLGRSSALFSWNHEQDCFVQNVKAMRVSGCSAASIESVVAIFMSCGNLTRSLRTFVATTYETSTSPYAVAVADAISDLLNLLQSRFSKLVLEPKSILYLQAAFRPVDLLLAEFCEIMQMMNLGQSDEKVLSFLWTKLLSQEHSCSPTRHVLFEALAHISRPFLDHVEEWLGTKRDTGDNLGSGTVLRSFVKIENRSWVDEQGFDFSEPEYVLDEPSLPSFLSEEDARVMFETGRSLRFLKKHHADHPLAKSSILALAPSPGLDWQKTWTAAKTIEMKAAKYEKDLMDAIQRHSEQPSRIQDTSDSVGDACTLAIVGKDESDIAKHILGSIGTLSHPPGPFTKVNNLCMAIESCLDQSGEQHADPFRTLPLSLLSTISFKPLIAAQARVLNRTSLRLFFESHNIREHLAVQRRFHLLGDGLFASRLSHALFDPELETAERQKGVARVGATMGLRLSDRQTWPPASSELRLALMGVLSDSYQVSDTSGYKHGRHGSQRPTDLPGDLSFAVRDMSDEEIEKCKNSVSLEALDFLRLSYKPPAPIDLVITPIALYKYDQLFKLLLRVTRMLFAVSQLFLNSRNRRVHSRMSDQIAKRFKIEAQHFVTSISEYFFSVGIDAPWRVFERKLDEVEARIESNTASVLVSEQEGLDRLRIWHEEVLDRIMSALLLRKRQSPVMRVLENIFSLILQFGTTALHKHHPTHSEDEVNNDVRKLYFRFRGRVRDFIGMCRELSEMKELRTKAVDGREAGLFAKDEAPATNTISHLLSRLEVSSYYAEKK